jgi:endonuclease-3 related protein
MRQRLLKIFEILLENFGERHWWPGDTALEIIVGAVLTQNTSWKNVEKAIANLKSAGLLDIKSLHDAEEATLARHIRSSGYYNLKTIRLKNIIKVIHDEYMSSIELLREKQLFELRLQLLDVKGIGEETADSILLYALEKPIFVIDAYTKRFLTNHGLYDGSYRYSEVQAFFMNNLPSDTYLFNEYHALIVALCQQFCVKTPKCKECPLRNDKEY